MKRIPTVIILFFVSVGALFCQAIDSAYYLLAKPYTERPLTLYKGQLTSGSAYSYTISNRMFNHSGELMAHSNSGNNQILHKGDFSFSYGISDNLEVAMSCFMANGIKRGVTLENYQRTGPGYKTKVVFFNHNVYSKGLSDICLYLAYRFLQANKLELAARGAFLLPVGGYQSIYNVNEVPVARYMEGDETTFQAYELAEINGHGNGTTGAGLGLAGKYRFHKFAISLETLVLKGFGNQAKQVSRFVLTDEAKNMIRKDYPYLYYFGEKIDLGLGVHYQYKPWIHVFSKYRSGFWINQREVYDNTEVFPGNKNWHQVQVGYEFQANKNFRIWQAFAYDFSGINVNNDYMVKVGILWSGLL